MQTGLADGGIALLMMTAWVLPLATLVIALWLGLRFVRAAERLAYAAERLSHNTSPRS